MSWTRGLTAISCLCVAVVSASCTAGVERDAAAQDAAGGSPEGGAADPNGTHAAACASGGLPPTSSLFLAIDDMSMNMPPGLPSPSPAGFWWRLGPLGNWFFGSAGTEASPSGDSPRSDVGPPARESCLQGKCWSRHVQGDKLVSGVDLSAQLMHPQGAPVDLSSFAGIAFWARLVSPSGRLIVTLREGFPDPYRFLAAESSGSPWFAQGLAASDQWERFILLFDDFHQGVISGNSSGRTLNTAAVSTIDFVVGLGGESFDLLVNDLVLLCRGVCPAPPCPFPIEEVEAGQPKGP